MDLLLTPVSAVPAPRIADERFQHAGRRVSLRDVVVPLTCPQEPARAAGCAVFGAFNRHGVPVGVQLTGPRGSEGRVLAAADGAAGARAARRDRREQRFVLVQPRPTVPLGFWTEREAAGPLRSLAVGGAVARAVASRPGVITRTGLGRTLAFGQLVARPRDMAESTARSALLGMATAPGFAATRSEVRRYRLQGPEPEVPVTIAWAAMDRMTPPHQADHARELLPHANFVTLPDCGHAAMVDNPQLVARVILDALATRSRGEARPADHVQPNVD